MAHETVILKVREDYDLVEGTLTAAVCRPGHLMERIAAGTYRVHATAGGNAQKLFAIEDYLQGKGLDDSYVASARVLMIRASTGDRLALLITDDSSAAGGDINIGDPLESAGNGTLRKHSADSAGAVEFPEAIVAYADEAIDMSDSSGVHGRGHTACVVA